MDQWGRTSAKTAQRYACSLDQLKDFLKGKRAKPDIDGRIVADIIRARTADGVSNATIRRDLVALSERASTSPSIRAGFESNPVLARMKRLEERRDPITLPRAEDIELVISRAPGMIKDLIRARWSQAHAEDELIRAPAASDINHQNRQITVVGKRNKRPHHQPRTVRRL